MIGCGLGVDRGYGAHGAENPLPLPLSPKGRGERRLVSFEAGVGVERLAVSAVGEAVAMFQNNITY